MYEIKKINVISSALIGGWITTVLAIVYFLFIGLLTGMYNSYSSSDYALFSYIPYAIIGGYVTGFISGVLVAFLYNLWAQWVGGIKLEINQIVTAEEKTPKK